MPLQNFSASALHSSRSLPAFSARAFELYRHAGESSASCAFMHLAVAPCRDLTSTHNFLTSAAQRSEVHTYELQSRFDLVCRLLHEKKNSFAYRLRRRFALD